MYRLVKRITIALTVVLGCGILLTVDTVERAPSLSVVQAAQKGTETTITATYLTYELHEGYIHNWLVAGLDFEPADSTVDTPDITHLPLENAVFAHEGFKLRWTYYKTLCDHFINLPVTGVTAHPEHAWAYARVEAPADYAVRFVLTAYGPAALWVNGQYLSGLEVEYGSSPQHISLPGLLIAGHNEVLLRFALPASGSFSVGGALQIVRDGAPEHLPVHLPTTAPDIALRQYYERLLDTAYLESSVDLRGNRIPVHWPADLDLSGTCDVQIQDARHRIYVEQSPFVQAGLSVDAGHPARIWEGDYNVVVRAPAAEYYGHGLRYQYTLPVHIVDNAYSTERYGTYAGRRLEALQDAAKRENSVFSEIARLALGQSEPLTAQQIAALVDTAVTSESDLEWIGTLGLVTRLTAAGILDTPTRIEVEERLLAGLPDQWSESSDCALSALTWQLLAGQLYPERTLDAAGHTGAVLRRQSERRLRRQLKRQTVFTTAEGGCTLETNVVALAHLLDLVEDAHLRELSHTALDDLFLALDQYAFQGVLSSAFQRTTAPMATSNRLSDAAGISRLLWGIGVYNRYVAGTVSLAMSSYEPLALAYMLPFAEPAEIWLQQPLGTQANGWQALFATQTRRQQVLYRTPDVMLDSVTGYRPGAPGVDERLWQATLGPDAVVFVNHPANLSESSDHVPNRWLGNVALPAVAQWQETLVAVYTLPEEDWLGFTHAYFPAFAFDEIAVEGNWAFARKGEGYAALTASHDLDLIHTGPTAYQEIRAYGQHTVWLCLVGNAASDGSFAAFRKAVHALDVRFEALGVTMHTLRGEALDFEWGKPLYINGKPRRP